MPSETKAVGHDVPDTHRSRLVGDVIEITLGVRIFEVDRGRCDLVL